MAHLFALGAEIELVGGLGRGVGGDTFDDLDAGLLQRSYFFRVVLNQPNGRNAKQLQNLRRKLKVAAVRGVAQLQVASICSSGVRHYACQ